MFRHWIGGAFFLSVFFLTASVLNAAENNTSGIVLTRESQTEYKIIQAKNATVPEKYAVKELADFLKKVTNVEFSIIEEKDADVKTKGIYVGWTNFSKNSEIDESQLGEEEFVIKTVKQNLILTGGRPKGTLYAVYEFLEWHVGCHWLDRYVNIIPSQKTLKIPVLDIKRKPWFMIRSITPPLGTPDYVWDFLIRNKNYRYDFYGRRDFYPEGAFYKIVGRSNNKKVDHGCSVHTFSDYVNAKDWFETHPEYFSLGYDGKRIPAYAGSGPGQLCLTNPDVLKIALEKLRENIKLDRERAAGKGVPYPKIYNFNQNDKYDTHCQCSDCQEIVRREGSESGPLINFVNLLAKGIEKDYPDVMVSTIAYNKTATPPKHIKPRKNVLVDWCDVYTHVDLTRPLTDPLNSRNYNEIKGWSEISQNLGIGDDYWIDFGYYDVFPTPYSIIHSITEDIKLFARLGCKKYYAETAGYIIHGQNFKQMRLWLGYKLLDNPDFSTDMLIKVFMDGYYGAASEKMREFMEYQKKRVLADGQYLMVREAPHKLAYLDLEFFQTIEKIFDEAIALVDTDSIYYKNINDERLIVDAALLFMWPWLERKLPGDEKLPFDKELVINRYGQEWRDYRHYNYFYSNTPNFYSKKGSMVNIVCDLFRDPQLPEQFKNIPSKDIADFNWLTFSKLRPSQKFVDDEDAAGKMAVRPKGISAIAAAEEGGDKLARQYSENADKVTLDFGATGNASITVKPEEIPQDEKYHLYKIGRINITEGTMVWACNKKLGVNVDRIYKPDTNNPEDNIWTAYISLKVTGPAYVKSSKKENGVFMDRALLVRPQEVEEITEAEKKAVEDEREKLLSRPTVNASAVSNINKINWNKIESCDKWFTYKGDGELTNRKVSVKFLHDKKYLYVRMEEKMDTSKLVTRPGIFGGDDWELLFSAQRGIRPYRQLAVNPSGNIRELAYGEGEWQSGVKVDSKIMADVWQVTLSFPMDKLTAKGIKKGDELFLNILRGGKENLVWSPVYGDFFHSLARFGKLVIK